MFQIYIYHKTKYITIHFSILLIKNILFSCFYKPNEMNKIDKRLTILKTFTTWLTKQYDTKVRAIFFFCSAYTVLCLFYL